MSRFHPAANVPATPPKPPKPVVRTTVLPSPAGRAAAAVLTAPANTFRRLESQVGILTFILGFYLLLYVIPMVEILAYYAHIHLPIVPAVFLVITVALPFTGHATRFLRTSVAKPWLLLAFCYFMAALFSSYRGASVPFMMGYLLRTHVMPFFFCAIALSTVRVRHLMSWVTVGSLILLVICRLYGGYADGRFVIQQTSLENPNDLAFQILLDGAFLLFLVFRRSWIARGLWVLTVPLSLMYILKTASRASFVTIVAATILAWALSPRTTKVLFLAIWPAMLVLAALFVPSYTWSRLRLITADPESEIYSTGDVQLRAALESQMARQQLQRRAIELTLRHPLLGVGPQMFADAADSLVQMQTGRKSGWQAPHNVYLQVSSENGIPALIFYLWTIAACFRMNYRSFQRCKGIPGQELNRAQSFCLLLAVFVYSIGVLFCNVTYFSYLSLLVGFSSANYLAIEKERKEDRTTATASLASPVPQIA